MHKATWLFAWMLAGCGASGASSSGNVAHVAADEQGATTSGSTGDGPGTQEDKRPRAFDATGQAIPCERPTEECAAPKTNPELQVRCLAAGYRMAQCGCDMYCMGKPQPAEKTFYDADGKSQLCAKPKDDCSPTPARAAFQDACTDKGFRLEVCGCEWLCSGNPAK